MKTPYVPHIFGDEVQRRLRSRRGWLTAGVASSIPWPSSDVCVIYAGDDYFLLGSERNGKPSPPCIVIACQSNSEADHAIAKIYRFTSILSWFEGGYVEVSEYGWGSHPVLVGGQTVYSAMGIAGAKSFNCNHMPIVEQENVRKALAFWREGKRLDEVHDSYAFLSFYKVIESQFASSAEKAKWIAASIEQLTDRAAKRVAEMRADGIDVSRHLYDSGRCAVAHATLDGEIVDPDIPADKRRLSADLVVMEELARIYIRDELKVPDSRSLYRARDRLSPWASMLSPDVLAILRNGGETEGVSALTGQIVSVGLWPDGAVPGLERMTLYAEEVHRGVVKIALLNDRQTIVLVFYLDYPSGRIKASLEENGLRYGDVAPDESDVRAYHTFCYRVFTNKVAELTCGQHEPIDCDVVIPVNMILGMPVEEAIECAVKRWRNDQVTATEDSRQSSDE